MIYSTISIVGFCFLGGENKVWDHQKETREYCKSDVDILHESMKEYSKSGMETIGIDPLHYTTTAACFNAYRIKFYDPKKAPICILKPNEWKFIKRSFFGGRTETFQTYRVWTDHELRDGCGGSYKDVQSLYPSVQYYDELPCGDCKLTIHDKESWQNNHKFIMDKSNYGFYEVDVECNRELFCPILPCYEPINKDRKLVFSSKTKMRRVFHTAELRNAIENGYRITRIHQKLLFRHLLHLQICHLPVSGRGNDHTRRMRGAGGARPARGRGAA
jgi:hypothetical protein